MSTKHEIGAFQAKNTLGTLLDWVEAGDEVIITRRGKSIARMVNANIPADSANLAAEAAARIRDRREAAKKPIHWSDWKSMRDEGRR
ncbi:MAG TPA: type II toxin-antitoxin system prevent-host-death family antitoxin [Rhodanobacteraceae bacterium]